MNNLYEELMEMVLEDNGKTKLENLKEQYSDVFDLKIYGDESNSYMLEADIFDFMKKHHIYSVNEAQHIIAQVKSLDEDAMVLVEAAPEKGAMSVRQVEKWYNKFIKSACSKTEKIEEIDDRIKVLEACVTSMKRELKRAEDGRSDEQIKFMAKSLIPFNGIARLVGKQHDAFGWIGDVAGSVTNVLLPGVGIAVQLTVRYVLYKKMLTTQITKTEDAIEYLKNMKAELKKK